MTYKDKFEASENRAHYQNIATKISREMTDLRSKVQSSPNTPRRWVWELIQNAKDVHEIDGVDIKISFDPSEPNRHLKFKHTGKPFTADNIRFLIEQISSKERSKDETGKRKNTGKFGTGFLTTHMLSEIVEVKGVAKEDGLDHRKFKMKLDRSGLELDDITEAVKISKESISNLDDLPPFTSYQATHFNTTFTYPLLDNLSVRVAEKGLNDLENCLPFALAFVDEINSVETSHNNTVYFNSEEEVDDDSEVHLTTITIQDSESNEQNWFTVAKVTKGFTTVAIPVEDDFINGGIKILPIDTHIPKIFCDFPLIGTEDFPFPVIVNNPNFNPTDPRDGIFLTDTSERENKLIDDNKAFMKDAVELYFKLLDHAAKNKWDNLHLLAKIGSLSSPAPEWVSPKWFDNEITNPIRNKLLYSKIVRTANGDLAAILNEAGEKYMQFPMGASKEVRHRIWEQACSWFPHCLPDENDIELWAKLIWGDCGKLTLSVFAGFVENKKNIKDLSLVLKSKEPVQWLNDFYELLKLDEKEYLTIIDKKEIVPNQNGEFRKKSHLSKDEGDIEPLFKDILLELGINVRETAASEDINLDFDERIINQQSIVRDIITEVTEKTNDREVAKVFQKAFNQLLVYFRDFPHKSEKLFGAIYRKKHLLYDDEEILNNIDKAEQLDDLLKEYNLKTTDDIRALIEKYSIQPGGLLQVTQEILLSMGITSVEEWTKALEDKDLQALFSHDSVPTPDMYIYAQSHIAKAKKSVIAHLNTLPDYDLSNIEETAPTILAGIIKNDQQISIVVRPAYKNEVIIYYGSERDTLDFEPSELWIDDGKAVKQITLGHILKTAQIRKFPV